MGKSNEDLCNRRERLIGDAIKLKPLDRVPIWFQDAGYFPASYAGVTFRDINYESDKLFSSYKKTFIDFQPDMYFNPGQAFRLPGDASDLLGCKQVKLPGSGIGENTSFQYIEAEYMRAEDYDEFLDDPTGFTLNKMLARLFSSFEGFKNFPPIRNLITGFVGADMCSEFVKPEITEAIKSFYKAGVITKKHKEKSDAFVKEMNKLGIPLAFGSGTLAPFDFLCDNLRGLIGVSMDIYRCPDKLLAAIEKVTPYMIDGGIEGARASGNPRIVVTTHHGSDGFMSLDQFETFYWPSFKKVVSALIEEGLTPFLFLEGNWTQRLEYLAELPKGKILGMMDSTDMYKAKEILGNTMCMTGFMPVSVLQIGTPESVKECAKEIIDIVGKGGGYIMGPRSVMDLTKTELVKVWFDFTKEYGVYS